MRPVILSLLAAVVAAAAWICSAGATVDPAPAGPDSVATPFHRVAVVYFHPTIRCESCLRFEAAAAAVVDSCYADARAAGLLTWDTYDFEEPENQSRVALYAIEGSTLIVAEFLGAGVSRWLPLDRGWLLLEDGPALREYIRSEIARFLPAASPADSSRRGDSTTSERHGQ